MFKNYQHRADVFVEAVHELMNQSTPSMNEQMGASA
jgi:hypothetical protein